MDVRIYWKLRSIKCYLAFLIIFVIVLAIISDVLLKLSIENASRQQARYNLQQVKYCYEKSSKNDAISALKMCTAKSRVGFSGDVYVLDADTKEFIIENSSDVPNTPLYFTKSSVGKYFKDWTTAEKALKQIMLGKDSEEFSKVSYLFDDSIEWLEWVYLPDATKYIDGKRLIVVQGVQSDESLEQFRILERIGFLFAGILVFMLLVLHNVQISYNNRRASGRQRE